ncbi:unnamed protein product [Linum trigynum]|uniref:Uncharacterized protein n=1 Tax=Linum trigynum TaxID=586398 RepID=A0AAV2FYD9_9ROSI
MVDTQRGAGTGASKSRSTSLLRYSFRLRPCTRRVRPPALVSSTWPSGKMQASEYSDGQGGHGAGGGTSS